MLGLTNIQFIFTQIISTNVIIFKIIKINSYLLKIVKNMKIIKNQRKSQNACLNEIWQQVY